MTTSTYKYHHTHKGLWKKQKVGLAGTWFVKYQPGDFTALNEAMKQGQEYYQKFAEKLFAIRR